AWPRARPLLNRARGTAGKTATTWSVPDMPQRPRSHVLESLSRNAFKDLLEARGWVVHRLDDHDYGLDDHVEVFVAGSATGLKFYAQVRATDEPNLHKALGVRVRRQQQAYFGAVGDPVLVVRYHAPSQRLFGQWFHRIDPYPRTEPSGTIRIPESSVLTEDNVGELANEVALVRTVRSARVSWPLDVIVRCASQDEARDLAIAMAAVAGDSQPYLRFSADQSPQGTRLSVDLKPETLVVHGGLASTTIHGETSGRSVEDLAADAVLGLGVALASLEHLDAATTLFLQTAHIAPSISSGALLVRVTGALARGRRPNEALRIGKQLLDAGRSTEAEFLVSTVTMPISDSLDEDERRAVSQWHLSLASASETANNIPKAAAEYYSAGNWLFNSVHDYPEALDAFKHAAELDRSMRTGDIMPARGRPPCLSAANTTTRLRGIDGPSVSILTRTMRVPFSGTL
ncbi:MAG: DUF4365 domain-containing protein, partial [Actinobacteria bacterium]|nr:DUF4365 domain-containing protein [Actinomycetota bacterium]